MNKRILMTVLVALPALANTEVAKVNDQVITLEQVNARVAEQLHIGSMGAISKRAALEEIIKHDAAVQEAKKLKLEQDSVVAERINNVLYFALIERKLGADLNKITLSDAEAKNWYEKNPEIRTSQIFIAIGPDATEAEEQKITAKLDQVLSDVKSGKMSFAEAAQKNSEDPSAAMGGDLDYRMKDRLDQNYYKAAVRLNTGSISSPIRTPFGYHLIRLTGKHSWAEAERAHVKRIMLEEKRQELVSRYLNDLRQKAKVSINEKLIKE